MLRQVLLLLISSCLLSQSRFFDPTTPPIPYDDSDAYEVYAAILPLARPWNVTNSKSLVILSETRGFKMCLVPEKGTEEIFETAISEYVRLNEKTRLLQRNFDIEKPYELLTYDQLQSAIGGLAWEKFYQLYPGSGGYIELSTVGFNADRTIAVVYMGYMSGGLWGGGGFHVLQKKEGKWEPIKWKGEMCAWLS